MGERLMEGNLLDDMAKKVIGLGHCKKWKMEECLLFILERRKRTC